MNARCALSELGCSSEYEVARYRLGWPSSIHLQPFYEIRKSRLGSWCLPGLPWPVSRMRFRQPAPLMNFPSPSEQPPRSFWIVARPEGRAAAELKSSLAAEPESPAAIQNPLMRFSAPSAHQVERIYQRGVPCPLRSAFAVSATLTGSSPLDPARIFHRAALLGFQGAGHACDHREVRAPAEPLPIAACSAESTGTEVSVFALFE